MTKPCTQSTRTNSPLAILLLFSLVALPIGWISGEANDNRWLRRIAGPLFTLVACVVDQFVDMLIDTSEKVGPQAVIERLRAFDRVSMQTNEGGVILSDRTFF